MKHGPIALLDESTPVVCVATDSPVLDKVLSNVEEVRARGADVIAIATEGGGAGRPRSPTRRSRSPRTDWILQPILAILPLQLLAYDIARLAGSTSTSRATWRRRSPSSSGSPQDDAAGVGIDLIEIERLERALERHPRLAERLFTEAELAYAARAAPPGRHLAARFAAKEAVIKALGLGGLPAARDRGRGGGRAAARSLHGARPPRRAERGVELRVSLTHSRELAAAVAVASPSR